VAGRAAGSGFPGVGGRGLTAHLGTVEFGRSFLPSGRLLLPTAIETILGIQSR
jgi:hypothetical protein